MNAGRTPSRGYAMLLVLLVLMIIALSMGTLVWHLSANIAETRRVITTMRTDSGCASALDAAGRVITTTFKTNPSADPETLLAAICGVTGANCQTVDGVRLPRHLAATGTTVEHFAISTTSPQRPTTRRILGGPFIDRFAVEQAVVVVVTVKDQKTGRGCTQTDRYVVPALPITNFALFGTAPTTRWTPPMSIRRQNDGMLSSTCAPPTTITGCGSRMHVNGNAGGISTSDFPTPSLQVSTDQPHLNLATSTRGTNQILRPRVAAPTMSTKQNSLLTGGLTSMRWLVDVPASADTTTQRRARLAAQADIVIIDGVWYLNRDKNAPWPGKPIFSEHGGSTFSIPAPASGVVEATGNVGIGDFGFAAGDFPKLYSWYDRATATGFVRPQLDPAQGDRGVISYGSLAVTETSLSCTVDKDCPAATPECFRKDTTTGVCIAMEPGNWSGPAPAVQCTSGSTGFKGVSACSAGNEVKALVDGTRTGFGDNGKRILPINFNVRDFARALMSANPNELGAVLGTGGTAGDPGRFNGVVYITTRFRTANYPAQAEKSDGSNMPTAVCYKDEGNSTKGFSKCPGNSSSNSPSAFEPISQHVVPVGLCTPVGVNITGNGGSDFQHQPCATASRPNAVRVYAAGLVDSQVFPRGLTIATDLPLYAYGDINRVQTGKPHVKVGLVADRVTFQSRGWRDKFNPWFDVDALDSTLRDALLGAGATAPPTGVQVIESSLITGVPMRGGGIHNVGDVFRSVQPWEQNHFIMRGHIVVGYNSEWFRDIGDDDDDDDDGLGNDTDDTGNDVPTVADGLRWLPDFHLDNPSFQPPGMPLVSLPPTSRFRSR